MRVEHARIVYQRSDHRLLSLLALLLTSCVLAKGKLKESAVREEDRVLRDINVQLWNCSANGEGQTWKIQTEGYPNNRIVLQGSAPELVCDVANWGNVSGTNIHMHTPTQFFHAYNQQFKYDAESHKLTSLMNKLCVTAEGNFTGANVAIYNCQADRSTLQQWVYNATSGRITLLANPALCLDAGSSANCTIPPFSGYKYCDSTLTVQERVDDLLPRLQVAEKAQFLLAKGHTNGGVPGLGVTPFLYGECLHGVNTHQCGTAAPGSTGCPTSFPHALGLGATFNRTLWTLVGETISTEARALFNQGLIGLAMWAPNINLFRDPRWGRGQEVPGEDPYLTSEYVARYSRALQEGDDPRYFKLISSCKHFSAYDLERVGNVTRHTFNAIVSEQDLVEYYWVPFRSCVERAHAKSIMCSYNAVNGVPSCANSLFQNEIVREEWGFDGFIVSDCGAISNFGAHNYTNSSEAASKAAIKGGTDTNCGSTYAKSLADAVTHGLLTEDQLDVSVRRVMEYMFRLGYMDPADQQPYNLLSGKDVDTEAHRQLALEAAHQMIVLLKNDNGMLPLSVSKIAAVAVIGPQANATQLLLSNYHGSNTLVDSHSILMGLSSRVGTQVEIHYVAGLSFPNSTDQSDFSTAATAARSSDVAIVCVGLSQTEEKEGHDRTNLTLPGAQDKLVQEILKAQPNTIVVLINGGPLAIPEIKDSVPAIVEAFYPGELGGDAIADVLFGNVNPSGRLPNTVYPAEYIKRSYFDMNLRDNGGCTYQHYTGDALWEFGFGLSYTTFNYTWSSGSIGTDENGVYRVHSSLAASVSDTPLMYTVSVKNTGKVGGADSVLGFLKSSGEQPDAPIRELFDFGRVYLEAGESAVVHLTVGPGVLSLTDSSGVQSVRSGKYIVEVGDLRSAFEVFGPDVELFSLPKVKERHEANIVKERHEAKIVPY